MLPSHGMQDTGNTCCKVRSRMPSGNEWHLVSFFVLATSIPTATHRSASRGGEVHTAVMSVPAISCRCRVTDPSLSSIICRACHCSRRGTIMVQFVATDAQTPQGKHDS